MKHAWDNYRQYGWGHNELKPIARKGHSTNIFGRLYFLVCFLFFFNISIHAILFERLPKIPSILCFNINLLKYGWQKCIDYFNGTSMNYFTKLSFWESNVLLLLQKLSCIYVHCYVVYAYIYKNKIYSALMIFWDAMNINLFLKETTSSCLDLCV